MNNTANNSTNTSKFNDCTVYVLGGMSNVVRVDVREIEIEEGVKYAQYNDALRVKYIAKGKRKASGRYLTYKPFLIVVERKDAIDPDGLFDGSSNLSDTTDVTMYRSRYSSHDGGWVRDFMSKLRSKNINPLFQVVSE